MVYYKNKLYKTLDYWSRDMVNLYFLEKGQGIVFPPYFVYNFSIKMFLMFYAIKGWVTYRFSYEMRHNDANKITPSTSHPPPHPTPCQMRHFQNFDKIHSFLKPVLNILVLGNLTVEWGEGVIKEGAGILHQIYRLKRVLIVWGIWFIRVRVGII